MTEADYIVILVAVLSCLGVALHLVRVYIRDKKQLATSKPFRGTSPFYTKTSPRPFSGTFCIPNIQDSEKPILGIDLGTCTSSVGIIYKNKPFIVKNKEGEEREPSLVTFTKEGLIYVGSEAGKILEKYEATNITISSIKRKMGNIEGTVIINGRKYYPQIISALILAYLKKQAEDCFGLSFEDAVVSVPANFNIIQKKATKEAAELAGLRVLRIENEAVASAVGHGLPYGGEAKIVVVDIGGGTFDCAVLLVGEGVFEVKAVTGDTQLGGEDFTDKVLEYIERYIRHEEGIEIEQSLVNKQRLREAAEKAKIELSSQQTVEINIPYMQTISNVFVNIGVCITRENYEKLIKKYVDKIAILANNAIKSSGYAMRDIDRVVLVGGASKTPIIRAEIEKIFGKNKISPLKYANPETAVVVGTTIMASILGAHKGTEELLVLDVFPKSLGIELEGGKFDCLIEKNATIPTFKSKTFTTTKDNQEAVNIALYVGESENIRENEFICNLVLDGIPLAKKGVPKIEVKIVIDANGIIHVSGKDLGTAKEVLARVDMANTLTQDEREEISKSIKDWIYFDKKISF